MNVIIIFCLAVLLVIMAVMIFHRSQAVQRIGTIGLTLVLAIGGASLYGFLKASEFAEEQYEKMYTLSLGNVYSYMKELESNEEIYSYNNEELLKQSASAADDALPAVTNSDLSYMDMSLVCKDETGTYYECYNDGQNKTFWNDVEDKALDMIAVSIKKQAAICRKTSDGNFLLAITDKTRVAPSYAMVVKVSAKAMNTEIRHLKLQYAVLSLFFIAAGMALTGFVVAMQEKEIRRMLRLVSQVAEGRKNWDSLKADNKPVLRESTEMHTLQSGLWQIASNIEWMNYSKYRMLQAYYRFAPKQIEKILHRETILDVGPLDRVTTEAALAIVSFAEEDSLPEREYLRMMVKNYMRLGEVRKEYEGVIISGSSDLSTVKLMFNEETKKALDFGIRLAAHEDQNDGAGDAFILLHRTRFVYGVAGDDEQAFTYVHSNELKALDNYVEKLRNIGVRMAVTDYVHEVIEKDTVTRYIGYIEDTDYTFKLYEVLDAHPADERQKRLELKPKFQKALGLFYKSDFYLARNLFSEILRSCPTDEVAKWYLFLCENSLNSEDLENQSFALFSQK